jgi:hypothetical protein
MDLVAFKYIYKKVTLLLLLLLLLTAIGLSPGGSGSQVSKLPLHASHVALPT